MSRRGVLMVETLLAATLAGMMLVLIVDLFPSSMATVRKAEQRTQASALADSVLEERSLWSFGRLPVGLSQDLDPQTFQGIQYKLHFSVEPAATENDKFLRDLRVKVSWPEGSGTLEVTRELWVHRLPSQL